MDIHAKLAAIARDAAASTQAAPLSTRSIGRLDAGTHTTRIEAVDTALLPTRGWVDITFGDSAGNTHRERIWVLRRDGTALSDGTTRLITGLFGGMDQWLVALGIDTDQAWHLLRGMRAEIIIEPGPGYQLVQAPEGWLAQVGDRVVARAATIDATRTAAEAAGHRRAYLRLRSIHGHHDHNCSALLSAIEALNKFDITGVFK